MLIQEKSLWKKCPTPMLLAWITWTQSACSYMKMAACKRGGVYWTNAWMQKLFLGLYGCLGGGLSFCFLEGKVPKLIFGNFCIWPNFSVVLHMNPMCGSGWARGRGSEPLWKNEFIYSKVLKQRPSPPHPENLWIHTWTLQPEDVLLWPIYLKLLSFYWEE